MLKPGLVGIVGVLFATSVFSTGCSSTTHNPSGDAAHGGGADGGDAGAATASGTHTGASSSGGADASGGSDSAGGTGTAPPGDPTTAQGFCSGYFSLVAGLFAKCWGLSETQEKEIFADPTICQRFLDSVAQKHIAFDGAYGAACLKELKAALVCEGNVDESSAPDCLTVIKPLVPVGEACSPDGGTALGHECMGDAFCQEATTYACTGVCTARSPIGAPCEAFSTKVECAADAACDSVAKKCVAEPPPAKLDEACGSAPPAKCDVGLWCDIPDGADEGKCAARKASGPCKYSSECLRTKICAGPEGAGACADPKPLGASCTPGNGECNLLGHCDDTLKCSDLEAGEGEPCGRISGESVPCQHGLYCDGGLLGPGVCHVPKAAGATCTGTSVGECAGDRGHCDSTDKTCVACQ